MYKNYGINVKCVYTGNNNINIHKQLWLTFDSQQDERTVIKLFMQAMRLGELTWMQRVLSCSGGHRELQVSSSMDKYDHLNWDVHL